MDLASMVTMAVGVFLLVDAINAGLTRRTRPPRWSDLVVPAIAVGVVVLLWVAWSAITGLSDIVRSNGG